MTIDEAINVINNADLSKVEDKVIKAIFYICTTCEDVTREKQMLVEIDHLHKYISNLETQITMASEDAISRQAVLKQLKGCLTGGDTEYEYVKLHIDSIPSVSPARPKGKWIDYSDEGYVECPFCHSATNCEGNIDELHYCFSCGADNGCEQE